MLNSGQLIALLGGVVLIGFIVIASMRVAPMRSCWRKRGRRSLRHDDPDTGRSAGGGGDPAIMMSNEASPTLVRDTIYSAVAARHQRHPGLAALMGGIKHGEQSYNDDSARTYSVMIMTAMGVSMVVPEFIPEADWKIYSAFTIGAMVVLYTLFLRMQVGPHSYFFSYSYPQKRRRKEPVQEEPTISLGLSIANLGVWRGGDWRAGGSDVEDFRSWPGRNRSPAGADGDRGGGDLGGAGNPHGVLLRGPGQSHAVGGQHRLGGVVVDGDSHGAGDGSHGAVHRPTLSDGHDSGATVMVFITLIVSAINLNDGETNAIEGMTHFVLFATFIMLSLLGAECCGRPAW